MPWAKYIPYYTNVVKIFYLAMKKLNISLLFLVCALFACSKPQTTEETLDDMPLTPRAVELLNHIAHARNTDESILDYGHYATDLQREMLLIVDTCPNRAHRFQVRRLATALSMDMMSSVMDDSLQMQFYLDSILLPYQQVNSHWYIEQSDTLTEFLCEPYLAEDTMVHIFRMSLIFNNRGRSFAMVSYPDNAINSPFLMFATDEDLTSPDYVISEEDEETDVIPPSEENYLTMFIPMELLLPQMLNHSQLFLAYMSSDGETKEEQFKMTMFALEEFQHQYHDWLKQPHK